MEDELFLTGKINDDYESITIFNSKFFKKALRALSKYDIEIRLIRKYSKRSLQQNKYLWGVVYPLIVRYRLNTLGEKTTPEEVHLHNLQIIQGYKINIKLIDGEEVFIVNKKSTRAMSTIEFNDMVEKLQIYYAEEFDLYIPDPNEVENINYRIK